MVQTSCVKLTAFCCQDLWSPYINDNVYCGFGFPTLHNTIGVHPMACKVVHFYVRKSPSQSDQYVKVGSLLWLAGRFTHVKLYDFTRHRVYPLCVCDWVPGCKWMNCFFQNLGIFNWTWPEWRKMTVYFMWIRQLWWFIQGMNEFPRRNRNPLTRLWNSAIKLCNNAFNEIRRLLYLTDIRTHFIRKLGFFLSCKKCTLHC